MPLLKPIRQQKESDQVFEQLKSLYTKESLSPGNNSIIEKLSVEIHFA